MRDANRFLAILICVFGCSAFSANAAVDPASSSTTYATDVIHGFLPVLQTTTPVPGSRRVPNDFDGNGTSDLVWFNSYMSQLGFWMMSAKPPGAEGSGIKRIGARTMDITAGYIVGAVGDLDGDGYTDLVFTSDSNDLWLWTNSGHGSFTSRRIYDYPRKWRLVGAGDVNGDGQDDLLWTNPNDCLFAYWLMRGGERIGSKIIPVACGYYPGGIGYYTPSNRISILWTSPSEDLYIWDSTGSGFRSYDLTPYIDLHHAWIVGGGFAGRGIGLESWSKVDFRDFNGRGETFDRIFDARGRQTAIRKVATTWTGPVGYTTYEPSAYVLTADNSGLYYKVGGDSPLMVGGLAGGNLATSGSAPDLRVGEQWPVPIFWEVVGSGGYWMAAPWVNP